MVNKSIKYIAIPCKVYFACTNELASYKHCYIYVFVLFWEEWWEIDCYVYFWYLGVIVEELWAEELAKFSKARV